MYSETISLEKLLDPTNKIILNDPTSTKALETTTQSKAFPIFLCILYIVFKLNQMYNGFNELAFSVQEVLLDTVSLYLFILIIELVITKN
jgi:hypothetical protein